MDNKRISEIFNSKGAIDVRYDGNSVWIESIDKEEGIAVVKNLKTNERMSVSIYKLME